ncbi:MAG: hypothetical protein WBU92_02490, partial [Candidatus Dormiibacterota bacterium]
MADDFGLGDEVLRAFSDLGDSGSGLEGLRPILVARAQAVVGDATLAGLVAQQVLVDLAARSPVDFQSASEMGAWLAIRVAQTAALFAGMLAPPIGSGPTSVPLRRASLLGAAGVSWRRLVRVPTVVALTGLASLAAASAAVALTLTTPFVATRLAPDGTFPISAPTGLAPHLVAPPTPKPTTPSPFRPAPSPSPKAATSPSTLVTVAEPPSTAAPTARTPAPQPSTPPPSPPPPPSLPPPPSPPPPP